MDKRTKLVIKQIFSCHNKETKRDNTQKLTKPLKSKIYVFEAGPTDKRTKQCVNKMCRGHRSFSGNFSCISSMTAEKITFST